MVGFCQTPALLLLLLQFWLKPKPFLNPRHGLKAMAINNTVEILKAQV